MAKNGPFYIKSPVKDFHGRARRHRTVLPPPLNTPLDRPTENRNSYNNVRLKNREMTEIRKKNK